MSALRNTFAAAAMAAALLAQAQTTQNPPAPRYGNSMEEVRGGLAGVKKDTSSAAFVHEAAQSGMTEIELARMALTKSRDENIRKFAQQMIQDHGKAGEELQALAKRKSIPAPAELDTDHVKVKDALAAKSASAFDSAYAQQMTQDHDAAVALFREASKSTDADFAAFARKTLPTLEAHQRLARKLHRH
jgi:putative membrane protein